MAFFYAPSGGLEPGFYGWAVILDWHQDGRGLYFRPVAPSDHLKMHPWWDDEAREVANRIRGKVKQGTLWRVPEDLAKDIAVGMTGWVGRQVEPAR